MSIHHSEILQDIARKAMRERGLLPDFSASVLAELDALQRPAGGPANHQAISVIWAASRGLPLTTMIPAILISSLSRRPCRETRSGYSSPSPMSTRW